MNMKYKIIVAGSIILVSFAFGRYSVSTVSSAHTVIDKNQTSDKQTNTDTHKVTTITEDPAGKKVTTIIEDTKIDTKKSSETITQVDQIVTAPKKSLINISALASLDTSSGFTPVYGISANKEFLGPITIGAFGMTNGVVGLSVGVNF